MALGQEERVARRYARALFDACEPTQFDLVSEQLKQLAQLWDMSADFREANLNPRVTDAQRSDILESVVSFHGGWRNDQLRRTAQILVSRRKAAILPALSNLFTSLVREFRKNLTIQIASATEVTETEKDSMKNKLSIALGGEVTLTVKHSPELLGGITLRLGDRYLDRSVSGTLGRIASQLAK